MTVFFKTKNIFELIIHQNLYILDNYIKNLEDLLKENIKEFEKWVDKEIENLNHLKDIEKNDYINSLSDEYHLISENFPNILRASLFISCYSIFEYGLLSLCEHIQKKGIHKKKLNKYDGKGIVRAKNYLEGVYKINFTKKIPSWNYIDNYRLIRNLIVHDQGRLDTSDNSDKAEKVRNFIKNKTWVELEDKYYLKDKRIQIIQFKKAFFKEVKKTIEDFSKELSKVLK